MKEFEKILSTPLISKDGKTMVSVGTLFAGALGAVVLYFSIPERKRKNLF